MSTCCSDSTPLPPKVERECKCTKNVDGTCCCGPTCCPPNEVVPPNIIKPPVLNPITDEEATLHLIIPISNYVGYEKRSILFFQFKKHIESLKHIIPYYVEIAFGDHPFIYTDNGNPRHLQLRTSDICWAKERSCNLAVRLLPKDWKYIGLCDADIQFINENVGMDTIKALQHYDVVQMFSTMMNLGPKGEILSTFPGFAYRYSQDPVHFLDKNNRYGFPHTGFNMCFTRRAFQALGGFIDFCILGSGDHHMWMSLVGRASESVPASMPLGYKKLILDWEGRAERHIRRNIGYVNGTLVHRFHGKFKDRKYQERWQILISNKFDPVLDLKVDWNTGLYIIDDKVRLTAQIREYMLNRNEDSIDL